MDPSRPDRILQEWNEVADGARRPVTPPARMSVRGGPSGTNLAGALVLVAALVIAVAWLGRPGPAGEIGAIGSSEPTASATPVATPSASASPTAAASPTPTAAPTRTATTRPTATPAPGPCDPANLAARITLWEGAAGSRIAHVELTNAGSSTCTVRAMDRPQLVDGKGSVLIDGQDPSSTATVTVTPGGVLNTLVQASNYCGPDPAPPVSVAFVQSGGGRFVATPFSSTDTTVPPCNGAGSPAAIEMHPWAH
jgi:hypothetical protein